LAKIAALELSRDINLAQFSLFLRQAGITHRINEAGEQQVLWVETPEQKDAVLIAYEHFKRDELPVVHVSSPVSSRRVRHKVLRDVMRSPLTITLIVANILCFPVTMGVDEGHFTQWLGELTLLNFNVMGDRLYFANLDYTLDSGQLWRLVTPMLLHFGWMHIVFNLLWVWEIGRRIEWTCGARWLLPLVLLTSISANLTQYFMSGANLFGGMSGVVFGLLGFAFVWSQWLPARTIGLPRGIYIFMLAFLVIGFSGAFDLLQLGSLANGAHLGGLLGGVAVGALAVAFTKLSGRLQP
jgi:GlpG protein